jgi:PHD/YefM family antitoxin component YafN of YafNO toxin-antitoxin module
VIQSRSVTSSKKEAPIMSISLTDDIKAIGELERHPRAMLHQLRATGRPIVFTVKGKPGIVLLDAATYERRLKSANLAQVLREGEADVAAGRTRPVREFLKELKIAKVVSS